MDWNGAQSISTAMNHWYESIRCGLLRPSPSRSPAGRDYRIRSVQVLSFANHPPPLLSHSTTLRARRQIPAVEMSPQSPSQSGKLHAMHAAFLFKQNLKKQASPASEATFTNFATARSMARSLPPTLGSLAARILPILPPRPPDTWDFVNAFAEMPKPRYGMS